MSVVPRRRALGSAATVGALVAAVSLTAFSSSALSSSALATPPTPSTNPHLVAAAGSAVMAAKIGWVKAEPSCAAPTPGRVGCLAVRLVPAQAGMQRAVPVVRSAAARGPAGGYRPADLARAYGFNPAVGGVGQTVAIVDTYDDPNALTDLNVFNAHYGLPKETSSSFRKVNQWGTTTGLPSADAGWAVEISLDVQAVRAVCSKCKILLVEAASSSSTNMAAAVNRAAKLGATEISNSYGGAETDPGSRLAGVVKAFDHPGVVITASTGDSGWYDWDLANFGGVSSNAPEFPAALPTVVAVAGTKLTVNSDGTRNKETVWNEDGAEDQSANSGASGGGCSTVYAAPAWQTSTVGFSGTGCGKRRQTGDVAALADPYTGFDIYDSYGHSGSARWMTVGGTSLAAPLVAGMWALAGGSGGVAYPAQSLYRNLARHPSALHDVVSGGNGYCGGDPAKHCSAVVTEDTGGVTGNPNEMGVGLMDCGFAATGPAIVSHRNQCNAAKGYDGPSGVGTAVGLNAFKRVP